MSDLFPCLPKHMLRRVLRNGVRVPTEPGPLRETATTLERLGIIALTYRRYVKCANPADEDYAELPNPACCGQIEVTGQTAPVCPECGRSVDYPARHKELFADLEVCLLPEGILSHLRRAFNALDTVRAAEALSHAALRVRLTDGRALVVPIVDYAGAGWRAGGEDAHRIHAYIIASPVNRPPRAHLERAFHIELAEILAEDRMWLAGVLSSAARPRNTAFIAYSARDAAFADRLAEDLVANGVGAWLDRWKVRVGDSIGERVRKAIAESDYLLVVLTPNSVASRWVREELDAAHLKELEAKRVFVLPVLYKDCDIPPLLEGRKYADCRGDRYPQGLQDLLSVLAPSFESGPAAPVRWGPWRPEGADDTRPSRTARRRLLAFINRHFDDEELRTLCFDLDVEYEDLPARSRSGKARELIAYLEKRGRLAELLELLAQERPGPFAEAGLTL